MQTGFSALILTDMTTPQMCSKTPAAFHTLCTAPMYSYGVRACKKAGAETIDVVSDRNEEMLSTSEMESWIAAQNRRVLILPGNLPLITAKQILALMERTDQRVVTVSEDETDLFFVTDCYTLSIAEEELRQQIIAKHQKNGVTIRIPQTVTIGPEVEIGSDSVIESGCTLAGKTRIGSGCIIGAYSQLFDTVTEDRVLICQSVLKQAKIGADTTVGPFAYLRPGSQIGDRVRIGDFVEIKNATIGNGTKVSHLTYVGDSDVGQKVNFGCGTVTANYDGYKKSRTRILDHAFIGCNTNLVAPVCVGRGAMTAAGSTITEDVPDGALAIARERQVTKLKRSPFGADQICTRKQEEEK